MPAVLLAIGLLAAHAAAVTETKAAIASPDSLARTAAVTESTATAAAPDSSSAANG